MYNHINILFSCGSDSWGGLEIITLDLAIKLQARGLNIKLLCKQNSRLQREAEKHGLVCLPYFRNDINTIGSIFKLKNYLKTVKTDIIHTHLSHDLWVLTPALKLAKSNTKLLLTKHMASGIKKDDMLHKYLYSRVDRVFAISEYIKTSLVNTIPADINKISLLHIGIDTNRFDRNRFSDIDLKKEAGFPKDKLTIGMLGRFTPGKGHEDLINAAKLLLSKYPDKLYFTVIGNASFGEDEYENKIKKMAEGLSSNDFRFMDFTDEPEKLMAALDILVFPSHDESFGRILAEAMSLGVPTAASRYAGVLDITVENETGSLFERMNPESMADAIEKLITKEDLRKKFSINGRKRILDKFDINNTIDDHIKYYSVNGQ